ncbi:hypothetical protein PCL_07763 [Purpureocillium lilacinum]|uniref:Uncharacterized protein n=1 Tax=Purpureocillium lilacinum TaxID=33203 RepID=A0A2U3EIW5_PURLI|nr:hypothetical protein PCL_07763 [Purpureocillium lilacinum]
MIACACSGANVSSLSAFPSGWVVCQTTAWDPDERSGPERWLHSIASLGADKYRSSISWNDVRALPLLAQTPDERERGLALDCESPLTAPGRMFRPPSYICSTPGRSHVKLTVRHALSLLVTVNGHPRWDSGFGASGLLPFDSLFSSAECVSTPPRGAGNRQPVRRSGQAALSSSQYELGQNSARPSPRAPRAWTNPSARSCRRALQGGLREPGWAPTVGHITVGLPPRPPTRPHVPAQSARRGGSFDAWAGDPWSLLEGRFRRSAGVWPGHLTLVHHPACPLKPHLGQRRMASRESACTPAPQLQLTPTTRRTHVLRAGRGLAASVQSCVLRAYLPRTPNVGDGRAVRRTVLAPPPPCCRRPLRPSVGGSGRLHCSASWSSRPFLAEHARYES